MQIASSNVDWDMLQLDSYLPPNGLKLVEIYSVPQLADR
ncbi:MAG: hypothetical protein K0R75_1363 [Paenibacillaceae bacterium]|jgi:hypothetical protein|nr:hypothetical protein [Paenibacillaceae bacterium]